MSSSDACIDNNIYLTCDEPLSASSTITTNQKRKQQIVGHDLFCYRFLVRGQVLEKRVKIIFQVLFGDFL